MPKTLSSSGQQEAQASSLLGFSAYVSVLEPMKWGGRTSLSRVACAACARPCRSYLHAHSRALWPGALPSGQATLALPRLTSQEAIITCRRALLHAPSGWVGGATQGGLYSKVRCGLRHRRDWFLFPTPSPVLLPREWL